MKQAAPEIKWTEPREFDFNLDEPPRKRWLPILEAFHPQFPRIRKEIALVLDEMGLNKCTSHMIRTLLRMAIVLGIPAHLEELQVIAQHMQLPLEHVLLLQLSYECYAKCTSLVLLDMNGARLHFRTMDWDLPFLRDITIRLCVRRNGQVLFRACTWVGYVGILTACSPSYSVAVNFRETPSDPAPSWWWQRCWNRVRTWPAVQSCLDATDLAQKVVALFRGHWPVGYLVRQVMEEGLAFDEALRTLRYRPLVAPCYVTLCSPRLPYVLVRHADSRKNGPSLSGGRLVQTNMDHDNVIRHESDPNAPLTQPNILHSLERAAFVHKALQSSSVVANKDEVWNRFQVAPLLNEETIYACLMNSSKATLDARVYPHPLTNGL